MRYGDVYKSNYTKDYYIFIGYKDSYFFNSVVNTFFKNLQDIIIDYCGFMRIQSDSDERNDIVNHLNIYVVDFLCKHTLEKSLTYMNMNISKEVNNAIVKNTLLQGYSNQEITSLIKTKEEYEIKKKEYIEIFKKRYKVFLEAKQGDFFIDDRVMLQYLGIYSHVYDLKDPSVTLMELEDLDAISCLVSGRYISQISFDRFLSMEKQGHQKILNLETDGIRKYRDFNTIKREFKGIDISL